MPALVDRHDAATREVSSNERLAAFAITGISGRGPVLHTERAPREKTSAASVTSKAMRSPVTRSSAGRRWKRISGGGCGRLPTSTSTALAARSRSSASRAPGRRPCAGSTGAAAVPADARAGAPSLSRRHDRARYQRLQCAMAADRRVAGNRISIRHRGVEIAAHAETTGRRQRVAVAGHLAGIGRRQSDTPSDTEPEPELLRPLSEYERVAGGSW